MSLSFLTHDDFSGSIHLPEIFSLYIIYIHTHTERDILIKNKNKLDSFYLRAGKLQYHKNNDKYVIGELKVIEPLFPTDENDSMESTRHAFISHHQLMDRWAVSTF